MWIWGNWGNFLIDKKMRLIATILLVFCSVFSFGQNDDARHFPQGHWSFSTPEFGYSELLIIDTNTVFFGRDIGDGFRGRTIKAFVLVERLPNTQNHPDTFFYRIVNENQLATTWYIKEAIMTRLPDDVINYTDYDCSFEMSQRDFVAFLESQFYGRMAKYNRYHPPQWWVYLPKETFTRIDDIAMEEYVANSADEPDTISHATIGFLEPQIVSKNTIEKMAPKLIEISWSADSTWVNIAIELTENCYADFMERQCEISKTGTLKLNYEKWDNGCVQQCRMRLYFQLVVSSTKSINSILLNGVLVEN
jgi:hypothetical protein